MKSDNLDFSPWFDLDEPPAADVLQHVRQRRSVSSRGVGFSHGQPGSYQDRFGQLDDRTLGNQTHPSASVSQRLAQHDDTTKRTSGLLLVFLNHIQLLPHIG